MNEMEEGKRERSLSGLAAPRKAAVYRSLRRTSQRNLLHTWSGLVSVGSGRPGRAAPPLWPRLPAGMTEVKGRLGTIGRQSTWRGRRQARVWCRGAAEKIN